ncbi:MAG: hypothetical protein WDN28_25740 [Chthoniobacter sp.]
MIRLRPGQRVVRVADEDQLVLAENLDLEAVALGGKSDQADIHIAG